MPETLRDRRVRYAHSILMPHYAPAALLGESGDLVGQRVLVLGGDVADTMGALMNTECRHAETCRPGCRTEAGSADLALVPHLTRENADRVISQAAHALCHHGRIVIALPEEGHAFISRTAMMLIGAGFNLPILRGEMRQRTLSAVRGGVPSRT